MTSAIEFPAVHYFPKGVGRSSAIPVVIGILMNASELGRCRRKSLARTMFEGSEILDSGGNVFPVRGVSGATLASPWWHLPVDWFNGTLVKANLVLGEPKRIALESFKQRLCEFVDQERELWASGIGAAEVQRQITQAMSHRAAIEVICGE